MAQRKRSSGRSAALSRRAAAGNQAVPPRGAITDETVLEPGDRIQIEWGGSWWQGSVVQVEDDGRVRISYDGYSSASDETVPRSRLWSPGETPPAAGAVAGAPVAQAASQGP